MPIYEQLTGRENHQKRDKIRQKRARERLNFSSLYNEADIAIWNVSSGSSRNEWRYVGAESLMSSVCVCVCVCQPHPNSSLRWPKPILKCLRVTADACDLRQTGPYDCILAPY